MTEQQQRKVIIRKFMRDHYTDERLAMLLAHARDGKLDYASCCCFIGIVTADHALKTCAQQSFIAEGGEHYREAADLPNSRGAGAAYSRLSHAKEIIDGDASDRDVVRRRILIPIIRAEMRRRERLRGVPLMLDVEAYYDRKNS